LPPTHKFGYHTAEMRTTLLLLFATTAVAADLELNLRTRVQVFRTGDEWQEVQLHKTFAPRESAILICDMWDNHWCKGAALRVNGLADKMDPVLKRARAKGILIIHAPSDVTDFYADSPQRRAMVALQKIDPPAQREIV